MKRAFQRSPSADAPVSFKAFRRFNDPDLAAFAGAKGRMMASMATHFPTDAMPDRVARALVARRAMPIKELFESFEFFERVRRRVRGPVLADLCCGHGLTGALFAVFERTVQEVVLVDKVQPASFARLMDALDEVAPWARGKIRFEERSVASVVPELAAGTAVVAVHACGARTDRAMEAAIALGGHVALMPCCYFRTADRAPSAIRSALSADMATDVDRTYRLEAAGYDVEWSAVPDVITACHRILVGRAPSLADHESNGEPQ